VEPIKELLLRGNEMKKSRQIEHHQN